MGHPGQRIEAKSKTPPLLRKDGAPGYLLGSYRIATAPEANSSRLTSLKSTRFDSPANNVGPWPASLGCTTNSYSSKAGLIGEWDLAVGPGEPAGIQYWIDGRRYTQDGAELRKR